MGEAVLEETADAVVIDDPACKGSEDVTTDGIPVMNPLLLGSWRVLLELPRAIVLEPIISSPDESKDTGMPLRFMFASAVTTWPAMVAIKGAAVGVGVANEAELVPMTRTDEPSDIGVLDTVIGEAPGVRVVPAIEIPSVSGTTGWPSITVDFSATGEFKRLGAACGPNAMELAPIFRVEDPNETGVFETVIGGAPGVSVVPAMDIP